MRALRRNILFGIGGLSIFIIPANANAQTSDLINCNGRLVRSLDFANRTRISGAENAAGSVYRYLGVGDGVNAEVTILGLKWWFP